MEKFTKEQVVMFGEYLLSEERRITQGNRCAGSGISFEDLESYLSGVYESDFEDYKKSPYFI